MNDDNNNNQGTQELNPAPMSAEDRQYFEKIKKREIEAERKAAEEAAKKAKRDEVWTQFKTDETYEVLKSTGFDTFIKDNPEFLDSPKLLANAVKQHKLELQLKQNSNGDPAGETEPEESGAQLEPGSTRQSADPKKLSINNEFMEKYGKGEITAADIQEMDIPPELKMQLKHNLSAPTSAMRKFFGDGNS